MAARAVLPTETIFQDTTDRAIGARWLPDSSALIWYVVQMPRGIDMFDIVCFTNGAVAAQTEIRAPIVKRMLRRGMRAADLNVLHLSPAMSFANTELGAKAVEFKISDGLDQRGFPLSIDVEIIFLKEIPGSRYRALEGTLTVVITSNGKLKCFQVASHEEIFNAEDVDP